ncbi:MBL fold metallo-hydrolase [Roseicyclus mahoneyensis]|uniref:Glyoxylase-like metal-dependent hydrolase (Beta-lactamase superfamily II) n=1 Tax=Roseicyclus mahoneyensis TaxID=164332 RepID=A0A316GI40_9RHOB|nr:MBL fold metallo-hydrolase [Roseicyclus mahoneyensis]PWK60261.1 glyoxylase-like metal-dependent hydrolase (beta-lactamase superfamily II) [Roseicyclus mahoneyensis]
MIQTPLEVAPAPGEATEVADGVLWLRIPLPMVLDHVNVYALRDADGWTLVDTGLDTKKTRAIWEAALAGPLKGLPVRRLIVTHHHPDHVGLAGWFQAQGVELWITRTAWLMARMLTLDEQPLPTEETLAFWRSAGMEAEVFEARRSERPFNFADIVHPMPLGFSRLLDGGTFQMGGRVWDIRFGQGHAPDHATFWSREDDVVIGGDQLLSTISPNLGVYATEPGADPVGEWFAACDALQPHARDAHLVLPGHKLPFTGLPDRLRQMIGNHHGALERLRAHLALGPKTAAECFPPLFKRQIDSGTYGLALVEAVAHLNHLHAIGAVIRDRRADGAWLYRLSP